MLDNSATVCYFSYMNTCKQCGKPTRTMVRGNRVQGTVAGIRNGRGSYMCQACIDQAAADQAAYAQKALAVSEARFAAAEERINQAQHKETA
jgi:hypothetical protein